MDDKERAACKSLALAVLESAFDDLQFAQRTKNKELEAEVFAWMNSDAEAYVFDFVPLCQWLGFSPSAVRNKLKGLR